MYMVYVYIYICTYIHILYKSVLFAFHLLVHWLTARIAGEEEGYGDEF